MGPQFYCNLTSNISVHCTSNANSHAWRFIFLCHLSGNVKIPLNKFQEILEMVKFFIGKNFSSVIIFVGKYFRHFADKVLANEVVKMINLIARGMRKFFTFYLNSYFKFKFIILRKNVGSQNFNNCFSPILLFFMLRFLCRVCWDHKRGIYYDEAFLWK